MLSLKAVHDSRRTRTAALSPSTRLHYNLSRAPIVGALIGSSARLTGAVTSSGGAAWAGRARLQRDGAKLPVGCQRNEERATGSSHIQRVVEDKQRDTTTLQAKKSGKPTAATKEGDVETLGTPTQVPALASLKAADHPRRALHRASVPLQVRELRTETLLSCRCGFSRF